MFIRKITPLLERQAKSFPATALMGPRQTGKTTLLKTLFPNRAYFNLEQIGTLQHIKEDPEGFLRSIDGPCIIDEAQNYPELFSYIQLYLDESSTTGQILLTSSHNFLLLEKITQSLAGRIALLQLLPLSYQEYVTDAPHLQNPWTFLVNGGYPRPYDQHLDRSIWFESYISTYLERDVRLITNIQDLGRFSLFLKLCAGFHGKLINLNSIATHCGISHTTAQNWLQILETSYIVYQLAPYHKNYKKRLVKSKKLYFYDSGLVCHLLGIDTDKQLQLHAERGAIFEGYVLSEILKYYTALGRKAPVYFWRDQTGNEVDIILEINNTPIAIEVKSTETYNERLTKGLKIWHKISQNTPNTTYLVYAGKQTFQRDKAVNILTWNNFLEHLPIPPISG